MRLLIFFIFILYIGMVSFEVIDFNSITDDEIIVEVKGHHEKSGLYTLNEYSTIEDLFTLIEVEDIYDLSMYNLQSILEDKDVIILQEEKETPLISINTATLQELDSLPGIGEKTAQKIIDYRTQNGLFKTLEDIMLVEGIKEAKFNQLKDYIRL